MNKLINLIESDDLSSFHLSISHKQGDHKLWIFTYDTKGVHESELNEEIKLNTYENLIEDHMQLGLTEDEAIKVVDSMIENNPDWWGNND